MIYGSRQLYLYFCWLSFYRPSKCCFFTYFRGYDTCLPMALLSNLMSFRRVYFKIHIIMWNYLLSPHLDAFHSAYNIHMTMDTGWQGSKGKQEMMLQWLYDRLSENSKISTKIKHFPAYEDMLIWFCHNFNTAVSVVESHDYGTLLSKYIGCSFHWIPCCCIMYFKEIRYDYLIACCDIVSFVYSGFILTYGEVKWEAVWLNMVELVQYWSKMKWLNFLQILPWSSILNWIITDCLRGCSNLSMP